MAAVPRLPDRAAKIAVSFVTIELLNAWASFSRSYVLSCVLVPRRANGGFVGIGVPLFSDFNGTIGLAMKRYKPFLTPKADGSWHRRDEPPWHDTQVLMMTCDDLRCSHLADVHAALSLRTRAFVDLPVFRNFYAHRNQGTAQAARNIAPYYSIPSFLHPTEILARAPSGRPYPLLVDWIDDVTATVGLLCD